APAPPRPAPARCAPRYCAAQPRFYFVYPRPLTIFRRREVPRGSATVRGARQAVLLPPLRADLRAAARLRDGGDPHLRRPEVRVPELLLPPDDPRRLLRRPPLRGAGGPVRRRPGAVLPVRPGARHAARVLRRRAARARAVGGVPDPHGLPRGHARRAAGGAPRGREERVPCD